MVTIAKTRQPVRMPRFGHRVDRTDPILRGCVGWWPLNDGAGTKANDIGVGGKDATLDFGGAEWSDGSLGKSLVFTADRYFSTPYSVNPDGAYFTFSAWVKLNSSMSHYLVDFADSSQTSNDCLLWVSGTSLRFGERGDTDSGLHKNATHTISATQDWFHVVGVRSGNSLRQLYFEGSYVAQSTNTIVNTSTTYDRIGFGCLADSTPVSSGDFQMQNVRIWDRDLTPTEVSRLYNEPWAGLEPLSPFSFFSGLSQIYAYYSAAFLQRL